MLCAVPHCKPASAQTSELAGARSTYLGFDANDYPGDAELAQLRRTFSFTGYWLNNPPGSDTNTWAGHRVDVARHGFGFLILFNGRLERELKSESNARAFGERDARGAVSAAKREGFAPGAVIFLDQEEGGSMVAEQMAYLVAWFDGVAAAGFRVGIYCSGMPANEGHGEFTITANFIRNHAGARQLVYFVYNDACPPSPGCVSPPNAPVPPASGVAFASVWQYAQSPRRRELTHHCASTYNADGKCYAPGWGQACHISTLNPPPRPIPHTRADVKWTAAGPVRPSFAFLTSSVVVGYVICIHLRVAR